MKFMIPCVNLWTRMSVKEIPFRPYWISWDLSSCLSLLVWSCWQLSLQREWNMQSLRESQHRWMHWQSVWRLFHRVTCPIRSRHWTVRMRSLTWFILQMKWQKSWVLSLPTPEKLWARWQTAITTSLPRTRICIRVILNSCFCLSVTWRHRWFRHCVPSRSLPGRYPQVQLTWQMLPRIWQRARPSRQVP